MNIINLSNLSKSGGSSGSPLLDNYLIQQGTVFEPFDSMTGFSVSTGTHTVDTSRSTTNGASIKTTSAVGSSGFITKTISADFSNVGAMSVDIYFEDTSNTDITTTQLIHIYLSSVTNLASSFEFKPTTGLFKRGWNRIVFTKDDFVNNAGESWSNTMIRVRYRIDANSGQTGVINWDNFVINRYNRPKCVVMFDDIFASAITEGKAYMDTKNMKGSLYITQDQIDSGGSKASSAQVQSAFDAGWDVMNHSKTHTDFTSLTDPQIADEVTNCTNFIISSGWNRNNSAYHFAYPFGAFSTASEAVLVGLGYKTQRTIHRYNQSTPIDNPNLLHCYTTSYPTYSLANMLTVIDQAIARGGTAFILFHNINTTPAVGNDFSIADFQTFIDYLVTKSGQIDTITFTQWYGGLASRAGIAQ